MRVAGRIDELIVGVNCDYISAASSRIARDDSPCGPYAAGRDDAVKLTEQCSFPSSIKFPLHGGNLTVDVFDGAFELKVE